MNSSSYRSTWSKDRDLCVCLSVCTFLQHWRCELCLFSLSSQFSINFSVMVWEMERFVEEKQGFCSRNQLAEIGNKDTILWKQMVFQKFPNVKSAVRMFQVTPHVEIKHISHETSKLTKLADAAAQSRSLQWVYVDFLLHCVPEQKQPFHALWVISNKWVVVCQKRCCWVLLILFVARC